MANKVEGSTMEEAVPTTTASSSWVPAIFRSSKNATTPGAEAQADTGDDRDEVMRIASNSDSEYDPTQYPAAPPNSENGSTTSSYDGFENINLARSQIEIHSNELLRILDDCATAKTRSERSHLDAQLQEESRKIALVLGDDIVQTRLALQDVFNQLNLEKQKREITEGRCSEHRQGRDEAEKLKKLADISNERMLAARSDALELAHTLQLDDQKRIHAEKLAEEIAKRQTDEIKHKDMHSALQAAHSKELELVERENKQRLAKAIAACDMENKATNTTMTGGIRRGFEFELRQMKEEFRSELHAHKSESFKLKDTIDDMQKKHVSQIAECKKQYLNSTKARAAKDSEIADIKENFERRRAIASLTAEKDLRASLRVAKAKHEVAIQDQHAAYRKKIHDSIACCEEVHAVKQAKAVAAMEEAFDERLKEERREWERNTSAKMNALAAKMATKNCECSWCRPRLHLYDFEVKAGEAKVCEKRKASSTQGLASTFIVGKPAAAEKISFVEIPKLTLPEPKHPHLFTGTK